MRESDGTPSRQSQRNHDKWQKNLGIDAECPKFIKKRAQYSKFSLSKIKSKLNKNIKNENANEVYILLCAAEDKDMSIKGFLKYGITDLRVLTELLLDFDALSQNNIQSYLDSTVNRGFTDRVIKFLNHPNVSVKNNSLTEWCIERAIGRGKIRIIENLLQHNLIQGDRIVAFMAHAKKEGQSIIEEKLREHLPEDYKQKPKQKNGWKKIDSQSISHIQTLPDHISLLRIFNFETERITTITRSSDPKAPAISERAEGFDVSMDSASLKLAYAALIERGGKPNQFFGKKVEGLLPRPSTSKLK